MGRQVDKGHHLALQSQHTHRMGQMAPHITLDHLAIERETGHGLALIALDIDKSVDINGAWPILGVEGERNLHLTSRSDRHGVIGGDGASTSGTHSGNAQHRLAHIAQTEGATNRAVLL